MPIVKRAHELWAQTGEQAGMKLLHVTGSLDLAPKGGGPVESSLQSCLDHGLTHEVLEGAEVTRRFPAFQLPEGHIGRSRTAPMYGNQGLYISIAECREGTDGPPPHAHSDTQESFYVLDGTFEMCSGFENETVVPVGPDDLIAMPKQIMRTFRNTTGRPARLLVIIQGPDRMNDTVSFSRSIGKDFERRFGPEVIEAYDKIRMTFDAEERLGV